MINNFRVTKAENGFMINVDRVMAVERDGEKFNEYTNETFVFESPSKLAKAVKLFVSDLKANADQPVPF